MYRVENFSIENITIKESHGWGISLEACRYGKLQKINFDATMYKYIDGIKSNMENQDGIDVRNGCSDVIISDITGSTGDDVIALTAIADDSGYKGGAEGSTHVMHSDWTRRESGIKNVVIKNVVARSYLCWMIRLLATNGATIERVVIDNVINNSESEDSKGLLIGSSGYGANYPDGIRDVCISNVVTSGYCAVDVAGYLKDAVITNVINRRKGGEKILQRNEGGLINVKTD